MVSFIPGPAHHPSPLALQTGKTPHRKSRCAQTAMPKRGAELDDESADKRAVGGVARTTRARMTASSSCTLPGVPPLLGSKLNALVEILLPAKHLTSDAKQVRLRQLWGTDVYTDDSDLVAVLVHTGHVKLKPAAPKTPLLVSLRICPAQARTRGRPERLRSRDWAGSTRASATRSSDACSTPPARCRPRRCRCCGRALSPPDCWLPCDRPAWTRADVRGAGDVVPRGVLTLVGPMVQVLGLIADQGTEPALDLHPPPQGSHVSRVQLGALRAALQQPSAEDGAYDKYTLSQVRAPHDMDARAVEAAGVPLPPAHVDRIEGNLDWEELIGARATCASAASSIRWCGSSSCRTLSPREDTAGPRGSPQRCTLPPPHPGH